jgi:hypothetical protein
MKMDEIRQRYELTGKRQIAVFIVLWVLIIAGFAIGLLNVASHGDDLVVLIVSLCTSVLYIFFMVYALFGSKMRILSYQIIMLIFAAGLATLAGFRFWNKDYAFAITDLLIVACLAAFVFTIKRTDATPRVLLVSALALQIPLTIFSEVGYLSASSIDWAYVAEAFQFVVLHLVAGGIYYSRIARHPIVDPAKANEKSFK